MPDPHSAQAGLGLQRLIYCSEATAETAAQIEQVLEHIVQASIRNNHNAAVTGYLLAHQGWFLQAIEGPKAAVTTTFERIAADPRHREPKVIASRAAEQRCFGNWTLAARSLTSADAGVIALYQKGQPFQPQRLTARSALGLLMTASQRPAKSILWIS